MQYCWRVLKVRSAPFGTHLSTSGPLVSMLPCRFGGVGKGVRRRGCRTCEVFAACSFHAMLVIWILHSPPLPIPLPLPLPIPLPLPGFLSLLPQGYEVENFERRNLLRRKFWHQARSAHAHA